MNPIDLTAVADMLAPGDVFEVIQLDAEATDPAEAVQVAQGRVVDERQDLGADLEARMAAFHKAAERIVDSPEWQRARGRTIYTAKREPLTPKQRRSKAKFKAQKKARKAQRR